MAKKVSLKKEDLPFQKAEFVSAVHKSIKTPIAEMKFCYLSKPFYYPGSHIPRYSVTLLFDRANGEHLDFLSKLEVLAKENEVETIGILDNGLISIKFQGKECPKILVVRPNEKTAKAILLEHDLAPGAKASVEFNLNTYFNKTAKKNGFNFSPTKVTFYLDEKIIKETVKKAKKDGNHKNSGNRPRAKSNGLGSGKLLPPKKRSVGK